LAVPTVRHDRLGDLLAEPISIDEKIIATLDRPFREDPGLQIVRGNIAPDGAIVKLSAFPDAKRTGQACLPRTFLISGPGSSTPQGRLGDLAIASSG
jgi:dihydroxyacid dehydratase/phosphogluconate dehydratase